MKLEYTGKQIFTISNCISFIRVFLAIPLWLCIGKIGEGNYRLYAILLCVLAYLTDITDGFLARKFNEITELGKIIDPFADKVVVGAVILKMYLEGLVPPFYFFMVIGRDILILAGGLIVSKKLGRVLPSNYLGKLTVVFIGFYFMMVLFNVPGTNIFNMLFFYGSIILIFASLIAYYIRAKEFIKKKDGVI